MAYIRICPRCNKEIEHKHIISYKNSLKKNSVCIKCSRKEVSNRPEVRLKNSEMQKGLRVGEKNHFFGRKHTKETKEKIVNSLLEYYESNAYPMQGKTPYDKLLKNQSLYQPDQPLPVPLLGITPNKWWSLPRCALAFSFSFHS